MLLRRHWFRAYVLLVISLTLVLALLERWSI